MSYPYHPEKIEPRVPAEHDFNVHYVPLNDAASNKDFTELQEYAVYIGGRLAAFETVYPNRYVRRRVVRTPQPTIYAVVTTIPVIVLLLLFLYLT